MNKLFWLIPLAIFFVQLLFTLSSNHQIRNEEAVASIREVWWFHERLLYQPANSNIGWYGAMSLIYSIFGFDLFWGKIYRLVLQFISLYALAYLLKKYLGEKLAWLPLITIGLSPTLLFWNTINNPYGLDLQFLPIVLFCLVSPIRPINLLGWFLAMFAWISFPTFVFYLPALIFLHLRRGVLAGLGAFLAPLVAFIIYFKGWPGRLFFSGGTFEPQRVDFFASLGAVVTNFFAHASAYYLEINQVEFSLIFPAITVAFIFVVSFRLLKYKDYKIYILLALFVMVFNVIISGFTVDGGIPGGRRNTPILASIYVLFVIAWHYISKLKIIGMGILSLILVHHLIVLPLNLESVKTTSFFKNSNWFGNGDPRVGLQHYVGQIRQKDVYFNCEETYKGDPQCQYGIIYAALSLACQKLSCQQMYGYFPGAGYQPLSIETINYWQEQEFEH